MPAGAADLVKRRTVASPFQAMRTDSPPGATCLCVVWSIGARADAGAVELRWTIDREFASAALHTLGASAPQPLAEARITRRVRDEHAGLDHLEVEGLLWLTLRQNSDNGAPPELLFARTTLFTRLNIPAGTYTAPQLV